MNIFIEGTDNNDNLSDSLENDTISGGLGDDRITGREGDDNLSGGIISLGDNDSIFVTPAANGGNDTLDGKCLTHYLIWVRKESRKLGS